jgi:signal transduction histidine kinase/CheY-like chemotaxis protein
MDKRLINLEVRLEPDVVHARQRARQVAALLGFPPLDQTRIATAASEIVRNAYQDAGGGRVEFALSPGPPTQLLIRVRERGRRHADLSLILDGRYDATAMGLGLLGAKRLMDDVKVTSEPNGGLVVCIAKDLPARKGPLTTAELAAISQELARQRPEGLLEELQVQNQELLRALQELRDRQAEVVDLHARELEETNRGVVALYAEFDENEKSLRRISDLKSRFLSNMSHEFRSPLNSIRSLCGFLLNRSDGDLNPEQAKQVTFIRRAADNLAALVNDLLDLARVEAGKAVVRPERFELETLFETLKGTIRPIVTLPSVSLIFEESDGIPPMTTDLGKVVQILNNFLSNAAKFTERGEIRMSARPGPGDTVILSVSDTGIGIAPRDQRRVFEEFGQVDSPIQNRVKGTGLGLPLSRKLAELLGGSVSVRSAPGAGSTFYALIPRVYRSPEEHASDRRAIVASEAARSFVLVVEDDPDMLALYEKYLEGSGFLVLCAWTLSEARRILGGLKPFAVLLDILLEAESGWTLLTEMKSKPALKNVPVLVVTVIDGKEQAFALGADDFCMKPISQTWLIEKLKTLEDRRPLERILIVDDDESARYLVRQQLLTLGRYELIEASTGHEALRRAASERPDAIFLDLLLSDMTGFEVLDRLKSDGATARIPIIINTSKVLEAEELERLSAGTAAVLSKSVVERQEVLERLRHALLNAGLESSHA